MKASVFGGHGFAMIRYHTEFQTIGAGYVADVQRSPLTGSVRVRVCDTVSETRDPDAGRWIALESVVDGDMCDACGLPLVNGCCLIPSSV